MGRARGLSWIWAIAAVACVGCATDDLGDSTALGANETEAPTPNEAPGVSEDDGLLAIPAGCPTTVATGVGIGQVPPNFELYDAEGEPHRLWDHCGKLIYLVAGAQW